MKKKFWIVWNAGCSEGFITDCKADAQSAISGEQNDALGFLSISVLGEEFFNQYGSEQCSVQEVELAIDGGAAK